MIPQDNEGPLAPESSDQCYWQHIEFINAGQADRTSIVLFLVTNFAAPVRICHFIKLGWVVRML